MSHIVELGDPILRQPTQPVADVQSAETKLAIDRMVTTLREEKGIGIAAPQVGIDQQIFIVAPSQKIERPYTNLETGLVVINPTISILSDDITHEWEGCLSIPGIRGYVPRQCNILIEYTDAMGNFRSETYTEFTARIFLHEYDHLVGVVFLDRIEKNTDIITDGYYAKIMEGNE
ncbi:MAG: peptide deformylase [Candidatus Margulisiibacteriota bacterium]